MARRGKNKLGVRLRTDVGGLAAHLSPLQAQEEHDQVTHPAGRQSCKGGHLSGPVMWRLVLTGVPMVVAGAGAMYAVAAGAASSLAASFAHEESDRHARAVEFDGMA